MKLIRPSPFYVSTHNNSTIRSYPLRQPLPSFTTFNNFHVDYKYYLYKLLNTGLRLGSSFRFISGVVSYYHVYVVVSYYHVVIVIDYPRKGVAWSSVCPPIGKTNDPTYISWLMVFYKIDYCDLNIFYVLVDTKLRIRVVNIWYWVLQWIESLS